MEALGLLIALASQVFLGEAGEEWVIKQDVRIVMPYTQQYGSQTEIVLPKGTIIYIGGGNE